MFKIEMQLFLPEPSNSNIIPLDYYKLIEIKLIG